MKERPILFKPELVRAILEDRKTVTRRLAKPLTVDSDLRSPFGVPGDRLWVRETWQLFDPDDDPIPPERFGPRAPYQGVCGGRPIYWTTCYRADGELSHPKDGPARWRPSLHMPRWACRLVLDVVDVRLERLQSITEEDAVREGVTARDAAVVFETTETGKKDRRDLANTARGAFACLWDSLAADGAGWGDDPWVWRIEFRRVA